MNKWAFLGNADSETIEQMYLEYKKNPEAVDVTWACFFSGFEFAKQDSFKEGSGSSLMLDKEFKVINLINAYRKRGHLFTKTNPVRQRRKYSPTLDLENYGLEEEDLETTFHAATEIGLPPSKLKDIIDHLSDTYCKSIGTEYMFIRKPNLTKWLESRIESTKNQTQFNTNEKKHIFKYLNQAVGFEQFLQKKFVGQKRFSLEGTETLIPALHYIMLYGSELGISEFIIGMAHRGRLNVLGNILKKPYSDIFREFMAEEYDDSVSLGDVKYHLGYGNTITLENGKSVELHMAPNPSHLEAVSPVIQGISRAEIDNRYTKDFTKLTPIII
ncbi:MAG: 2-oxoglutarate dehydrogenase E1 component, partial [Bacteroidales bacterium]|nr:2-oxoglutarate dehydrogenase E1 component [Bacteroidales bacterium]